MFDLFETTNTDDVSDMVNRTYFDPNRHSDGVMTISVKFLVKWDDLKPKPNSHYKEREIYPVKIKVLEDGRKPLYNQKDKKLTWDMPKSFLKMMAVQMNENLLTQTDVELFGTTLKLHINPSKKSQKYRKSEFTFKTKAEIKPKTAKETVKEQPIEEPVETPNEDMEFFKYVRSLYISNEMIKLTVDEVEKAIRIYERNKRQLLHNNDRNTYSALKSKIKYMETQND